jgi:putative ABC transport system permease protein
MKRDPSDFDEEVESHIALETDRLIAEGVRPGEAALRARRTFGNVTRVRETVYESGRWVWWDQLAQDVRYGLRTLCAKPALTVIAVLTLALGVGANTAVFSLFDTVLLAGLPFREPARLVALYEDHTQVGGPDIVQPSPASYVSWTRDNAQMTHPAFEGIAALDGFGDYDLTGRGEPEQVRGAAVSGNLFGVLGLRAIVGRAIQPEDDRPGAEPVVVLGEGYWRSKFGADPALVGQALTLNGIRRTVIGVVPGALQIPRPDTELWVPLALTEEQAGQRFNFYLNVLARLRPGVSEAQARSAMKVFAANLLRAFPGAVKMGTTVRPLRDVLASSVRSTLNLLLATVGIVLLIACANVGQLLLARGAGRAREMALRGALGAQRGRLLRQLLTESLLLAVAGAIAGTGIAAAALWFLARLIPQNFPQGTTLAINLPVLAYTAVLALITGVVFGAGPALISTRADPASALKQGGRSVSASGGRLRGSLITGEVALTILLLAAAGLLLRSYSQLHKVEPGYRTASILIADTVLSPAGYATPERRVGFYQDVLTQTARLPGVISAAYSSFAPLIMKGGRMGFLIDGRPDPAPDQQPKQITVDRSVSPGYLATMGIPLLEGRDFSERDTATSPRVVLINQTMAKTFWPNESPIGKRVKFGLSSSQSSPGYSIVGVMGDVREINLDRKPESELFMPLTSGALGPPFLWPRQLILRTRGDPLGQAESVRRVIRSVDANQPISSFQTMEDVVDQEFSRRDTQLILICASAALALLLASVGLYGVLSCTVAQMSPEIGVRMALGAQPGEAVAMVMRRMFVWVGLGLLMGLVAAGLLARFVQSFLFGVRATDPVTLAGVVALMLCVSLAASWLPASRAAAVDPIQSLRTD